VIRREHAYQGEPGGTCTVLINGERCGLGTEHHRKRRRHKHVGSAADSCAVCGLRIDQHYQPEKVPKRAHHAHVAPPDNIDPAAPCQKVLRNGQICGLPRNAHRGKAPIKKQHDFVGPDDADRNTPCERCGSPKKLHSGKRKYQPDPYIGIDGEGKGREDHLYVMMAASDESGTKRWKVKNDEGLTTEEIFEFLFSIPYGRMFAFSFGYDLTKMLEDLDEGRLFVLFRPDLRRRKPKKDSEADRIEQSRGPVPITWRGPKTGTLYHLNLVGTKFTLSKGRGKAKVTRIIWDIWKFYQTRFVDALKLWNVGTPEEWVMLQAMKDQRADFDKLTPEEIEEYCFLEVRHMAALTRKLVEAHDAVGLKLTGFYGAGSCATALLKVMGIADKLRPPPEEMQDAVARAFFGGRFENSRIGRIREKAYNYDISSAYPYQLCFLPCLVHARWELTRNRRKLNDVRHALVRYGFRNNAGITHLDWGPFPFRDVDGSICYPKVSGGGWVWRDEFLQGERLFFPMVEFKEAWILHQECDCQPFKDIARYYRERCRIGKEGPGIVLKLGPNSVYGKLAQSVGNAIFNNWIWAGMTTSGCRAQMLELIGLHEDRANVLMIATDGCYSLELLETPVPKDTGTYDVSVCKKHSKTCHECPPIYKPLGGWERDDIPQGVFIAQPGVYFPWNPTKEQIKKVRGRGVGKGAVLENWQRIVDSYEKHGIYRRDGELNTVHIANVSRFCGAKTSISVRHVGQRLVFTRALGDHIGKPEDDIEPEPHYGQWITREVVMQFDPHPKRERLVGRDGRLMLRSMPTNQMSAPYSKAIMSPEASELNKLQEELMEQPDIDFIDYDAGEDWG